MAWTNILKPAESSVSTGNTGEPIGLLMAITQSATSSSITSGWANINKPTSSTWTTIVKPTGSGWTSIVKPT